LAFCDGDRLGLLPVIPGSLAGTARKTRVSVLIRGVSWFA